MYPIPPTETLAETKTCKHCGTSFPITDKDLEFYDKVSPVFAGKKCAIPSPTLCPDCRQQRRLSFRNERKLYKRKCDATGRDIISIYSPDKPFKVYHQDEWWSDKWDPLSYGRDFDFNRPFFEQFEKMVGEVPRTGLYVDSTCENCDYTNQITNCKDSYLIISCSDSRECLYGKRMNGSESCVDGLLVVNSRSCYESVDIHSCYLCHYAIDSKNCSNSAFIHNCESCNNCVLCSDLSNKSYCINNVQYDREEYDLRKNELFSRHTFWQVLAQFQETLRKSVRRDLNMRNCENVLGDHVQNSKDSFIVFDAADVERVRYGQFVQDTDSSYDIDYNCCNSSFNYEIST